MARSSTRRFKTDRANYRATAAATAAPCWICGQPIDYEAAATDYGNDSRFELDHYYSVSTHPDLQHDTANFRASHAGCNRARGNSTVTSTLAGTLSRNWTG